MTPPYPCPGKCEGQTYKRYVNQFNPGQMLRCQETEPLVWHERAYAWLCPKHVRGANRRKAS